MKSLRVSSKKEPGKLAGALANIIREGGSVEIQAIGAGAVNQAVKGIAIAREFVAQEGVDLVTLPEFSKTSIDGEGRTAIKMVVERRLLQETKDGDE